MKLWTVASVLSVCSGHALAQCGFINGPTSALTRTVSFGTVIVQRDTPIGTVLATASTGPYNAGVQFFGCSVPFVYRYSMGIFSVPSSYGNNVYNTNIEGVGVRLANFNNKYLPFDAPFAANTYVYIPNIVVQLIKTKSGPVGAGVLTNGRLASGSIVNQFFVLHGSLVGTNTIVPVACSVSNTSIPVPMGNVPRSQFIAPGTVGDAIPFTIALNCDANTRVKVALNGNAHSSGVPGLLALNTLPGGATGLGVRLFYNNAPVNLRAPISVGTVPVSGPYSIALVARYYQVAANVTAGQANSTATFTMTYN